MLKKKIIASSIGNLTDARYFAAWGVHGVGFDLDLQSPDHISPAAFQAFREWISGPIAIGEFSGVQEKGEIEELIKTLSLDAVQLGPFAPEAWKFEVPVFQVNLFEQERNNANADAIIIKSENPNFEWREHLEVLKSMMSDKESYLDLPIDLHDFEEVIDVLKPEGFILRGGEEEKVGFKSYDEVDEIMELLEVEE